MSHFYLGEYLCKLRSPGPKNCTFAFVCSAIIILGIGVGLSSLVFFCELLPKITLKLKLCINQKKKIMQVCER